MTNPTQSTTAQRRDGERIMPTTVAHARRGPAEHRALILY
jgi:hypothetical protein